MIRYIEKLKITGVERDNIIELSTPNNKNSSINVICGENNTGKTFILKKMQALARKTQTVSNQNIGISDFGITMSNDGSTPKVMYFGKTWSLKEKLGQINLKKNSYVVSKELLMDKTNYEVFLMKLVHEVFIIRGELKIESFDEWINLKENRVDDMKFLNGDGKLYRLPSSIEIVNVIETIFNRKLYFRNINNTIELVGVNEDRFVLYKNWSDGDKALFYLIFMLYYEDPNILIVDEIENHLHPYYITAILKIIKTRKMQVVLATHNPHIIFSELVDKVFYISHENTKNTTFIYEDILSYEKIKTDNSPKRKVTFLKNDFLKISHVYDLFDVKDSKLLNQSKYIRDKSDIDLYTLFTKMYTYDILEAKEEIFADRQTTQLVELLNLKESIQDKRKISILEFGAGLGRMPNEINKITSLSSESIVWHCWEPVDTVRTSLIEACRNLNFINILDDIDNIPDGSIDIVIIANVIHEISPHKFAEMLVKAKSKIKKDSGAILISEMSPLLYPEKISISYPENYLKKILNNSGFNCRSDSFHIRDSNAYCVIAYPNGCDMGIDKIESIITTIISEIKLELLSSFITRRNLTTMKDFNSTLCELSTIVSIDLVQSKMWN